jgi:hypothetical protein
MPTETITPKPSPDTLAITPAPATPETPPAAPAPAKPDPTTIANDVDDIMVSLGYREAKPKPPKEPKPAEPTPPPAPAPEPVPEVPEKPAAPPAAEPPAKPPAKPKRADRLSREAIAEIVHDATKEAISEQPAAPPPTSPPDLTTGLDDAQRRSVAVLQAMEQTNPQKYRGLAQRTITGWQAFNAYQSKWEAENPGETFNPDEPEHAKVAERLMPEYDQDEFDDTKINLKVNARLAEQERENQRKQAGVKIKEKVDAALNQASVELVQQAEPELAHVLTTEGPDKMRAKDPLATRALSDTRAQLVPLISELERLSDPHLNYASIPGNVLHDELNQIATESERAIAALPAENQLDNQGRRFCPSYQYMSLNPAQRARYWTLTPDMIRSLVVRKYAHIAKERIGVYRTDALAEAERLGWKKGESASIPAPAAFAPPSTPPAPATPKPQAPSTAGSGDTIKTPGGSNTPPINLATAIVKDLFGS